MRKNIDCFGEKRREELVSRYDIEPMERVKLLGGQTKISCTARTLEDEYYCFSYKNKKDRKDEGTFVCGSHAADHFLKLLNTDAPSLFNPLKSDSLDYFSNSVEGGNEDIGQSKKEWNPLAKELFDAIHLLMICWNKTLRPGPLLNTKRGLEKYPNYEPYLNKIKMVNKSISKDKKNRTLSKMIEELQEKHLNLRQFTFDHINQRLKQENIESFF